MMEKIQRFGGAMMTPVLLFSFSGLVLAITIVLTNPMLMGSLANEGTIWHSFWSIIEDGAWTVFTQIEILFVIGLAIGLAKIEKGRAALTAAVTYFTFNNFVGGILSHFGAGLGIDYFSDVGAGTGLTYIAGVRTLDTSIIGAILISAISVWIHNRFFNKKLPDFLGIFQGSTLVYIVGFLLMIPMSILTVLIWPNVQSGISSMQGFMATSGVAGVWIYTFLERILIPTGLHHFIWQPFILGPAIVDGGIQPTWFENINYFAASTDPLIELFPEGGFALHGMSKVFGALGISAAIYSTARPERRKTVLSVLIPVTLTAMLTGITEPLEFTFLFIAPVLFAVHAFLAATMSATAFSFGVVGNFGSGLIEFFATNWLPLFHNHWGTYLIQIIIGLSFSAIYFFVFRFLILKYNFLTPGRELDEQEIKLYSKQDYKDKKNASKSSNNEENAFTEKARAYIEALGGADNLADVNNCATRLRISVKDAALVQSDGAFKEIGAFGVVRKNNAIQVIVGGDVVMVRAQMDELLNSSESKQD